MENIYPKSPSSFPCNLTKPSSTYTRNAWLAMLGLALFITLYFGLTAWFMNVAYATGVTISQGGDVKFPNLLAGGCALFLSIFMVKALFFVKHKQTTNDIQITPEQHPVLFQFLHKLADEAGAPRPNKVFLSAEINAAVFYDLTIFNLFFPSRKNLLIGLGLVNVLNLSEFKAVLAHEFGHFAQRSMAVGRWVYVAQQIAGQIIAKRDALDGFLRGLSRFDIRIAWVGWLLSLIVWSIRSLMDTIFSLVLIAQRALSRQMEFQADLVSVSLTGSDALVHALHKLIAADEAWSRTMNFCSDEYREGRAVKDAFAVQTQILQNLREIYNQADYGASPSIPLDNPQKHRIFTNKMAILPQMWSTHPDNSAREENTKNTYIAAEIDERDAWIIFNDPQPLRENMTKHIFATANATESDLALTLSNLKVNYSKIYLSPRFQGAYLGRSIAAFFKLVVASS